MEGEALCLALETPQKILEAAVNPVPVFCDTAEEKGFQETESRGLWCTPSIQRPPLYKNYLFIRALSQLCMILVTACMDAPEGPEVVWLYLTTLKQLQRFDWKLVVCDIQSFGAITSVLVVSGFTCPFASYSGGLLCRECR